MFDKKNLGKGTHTRFTQSKLNLGGLLIFMFEVG